MEVTLTVLLLLSQILQILSGGGGWGVASLIGTYQQASLPSLPTLLLAGLQNHPRASALTVPLPGRSFQFLPKTHRTLLPHNSSHPLGSCPTLLISGIQCPPHSYWPAFPFCSPPGPCIPTPPTLSSGASSAQNSPSSLPPPIFFNWALPWHPKE